MLALSELNPAIAPPFSIAMDEMNVELCAVKSSPYTTIEPPSVNELHNTKFTLSIVMLLEFSPTYIAPPFAEIHSVKLEFITVPLFPSQSIAPPRPVSALDT